MEPPVEPICFRRLIVCCDGEWEGAGKDPPVKGHPNSHVLVLSKCVLGDDTSSTTSPPIKQLVHYQGGEDDTLLYRRKDSDAHDTKVQFVEHCQAAYDFISGNYHAGDELFFFGFSFGAAVARTVAAFVADVGILRGQALTDFQEIFKLYQHDKPKMANELNKYRDQCEEELCKRDRESCDHYVQKVSSSKIKCVGVWDTAKLSEIPPGEETLRPGIGFGFHAMRIDLGVGFGVAKWTRSGDLTESQVIEQIQFKGTHRDIGGVGIHPKGIISLIWMIANLINHKLLAVDEINLKRLVPIEVLREGKYLKGVIDALRTPIELNPERQRIVLNREHATVNQASATLLPFELEMLKGSGYFRGSSVDLAEPARLKLSHPGAKRIVVFIDGTGNDGEDFNLSLRTNVWRLFQSVASVDVQTNTTQLKRYFSGVGTSGLAVTKYWGQMRGAGIVLMIKQAYTHIAANYSPGDEIFLFGFSRGAFAIRTLASLITEFGLYNPTPNSAEEEDLSQMWTDALHEPTLDIRDYKSNSNFKERLPMGNTVKCVGVWDTVVSVVDEDDRWFRSIFEPANYFGFRDELLDPKIENAFHAMALHEDRALFDVTKWKFEPVRNQERSRRFSQIWFPGFHADVGGGNPDQDLAILSLVWMIAKIEGELSDTPMLSIDHYQLRGVLFPSEPWAKMSPIKPAKKFYNRLIVGGYTARKLRELDTSQELIHQSCLPLTVPSSGSQTLSDEISHALTQVHWEEMLDLEKKVQSGWKTLYKEPVNKKTGFFKKLFFGEDLEFLPEKDAKDAFKKFLVKRYPRAHI